MEDQKKWIILTLKLILINLRKLIALKDLMNLKKLMRLEPIVKDLVVKETPLELAQRMKNRIMANADELIETAIKLALKGNKQMLKICLDYILPSTTNNAAGKLRLSQGGISLEKMPELAASLLSQVSEGTIDAKAAKELAEVMGVFLQSHEMVKSERRLDRLEAITKEVEERRKSGEVIDLRERFRLQEEVFS